jgi:hypothetical protein
VSASIIQIAPVFAFAAVWVGYNAILKASSICGIMTLLETSGTPSEFNATEVAVVPPVLSVARLMFVDVPLA